MFEIEDLKPGDVLIQKGRRGKQILFGDWLQGNWDLYADGYKVAADMLIEQIEGEPVEDRLICPALFLYRHFIELKLKSLVGTLDNLYGTRISENEFGKHPLYPLWLYVKTHLDCLRGGGDNAKVYTLLEARIKELDQLDPDGYHFRYPHNKKSDEMAIPESLSMRNLKVTMNKIYNALAMIEGGIDYERNSRALDAELEAEMRVASY